MPESSIIVEELEPEPKPIPKKQPEPVTEESPEPTPQSPRGSLPKDSAEELPQELDLPRTSYRRTISRTRTTPPSPRGSLPKESAEELPQELIYLTEPVTEEPAQKSFLTLQMRNIKIRTKNLLRLKIKS